MTTSIIHRCCFLLLFDFFCYNRVGDSMSATDRFQKIKEALKRELQIRKYKKEKNYEQIYREFGSKAYNTHIPYLYKIKEIRKLKKAHNYDLIMKKYGEKEYQKYISYVLKQDVLAQTGNIYLAKKEQIKYEFNKFFTKSIPSLTKSILVASAFLITISPALFGYLNESLIDENAQIYASEISEYNQSAIDYAEEINAIAIEHNLSHLDIIMKVMSDMWANIEGYGEPEIDAIGYYRLDINNGIGVCRHMADDIAFKLNEINPEYNARTICVYASEGSYTTSSIERKLVETETQNTISMEEETVMGIATDSLTKIIGNHAVTVVDIGEDTIIIDPTNPMIGVLKNGEIILLNPNDGHYEFTYVGNSFLLGMDTYEFESKLLQSYLNPSSIKELTERYGLEAQNESLNKLASIESKKLS